MKSTILNTRVWFAHEGKKAVKYGSHMTLVEAHQILNVIDTYFLSVDEFSKILYASDVQMAEESNNRFIGSLSTQISRYTSSSKVKRGTQLELYSGIEVQIEDNGRKIWVEWEDQFGQDIHEFTKFCLQHGINISARLALLDTLVVEAEAELT